MYPLPHEASPICDLYSPAMLNSHIFNLKPTPVLQIIPWTCSWVCQTYTCVWATPFHQSQHVFYQHFLLSGCCHEAEYQEVLSEQSVSVQKVSQVRTSSADLPAKKAHPCEMCGLILSDIFHLAEHQETHCKQKLYRCEVYGKKLCVSANVHQKQHTGEKSFRSHVDRVLFVKSCKLNVSGETLISREIRKDFFGQLWISSATDHLHSGEVKQWNQVCDSLSEGKS